jgi:hypothetical protein
MVYIKISPLRNGFNKNEAAAFQNHGIQKLIPLLHATKKKQRIIFPLLPFINQLKIHATFFSLSIHPI